MKNKRIVLILLSVLISFSCKTNDSDKYTEYKGDYFGQKPPALKPVIFAHDLLANSINTTFSPDGKEFFFVKDIDSNNTGDILWMRQINSKWTKPVVAPFNSLDTDNDICISQDGKTVYFRSWRKLEGKTMQESVSHLWFARKTHDGWSDPKPVLSNGKPIQAGYPSSARSGNLYFNRRSNRINNYGDLFMLKFEDSTFSAPLPLLNDPENEYHEGDMCVSPDESFVITSCWNRPDSLRGGESDLYISFQLDKDKWSPLIYMGEEINSDLSENCPTISPDGKYFFFVRYDGEKESSDDYWVSIDVILELKYNEHEETK